VIARPAPPAPARNPFVPIHPCPGSTVTRLGGVATAERASNPRRSHARNTHELDPTRRAPDRYGAVSSASVPPLSDAARHGYDPNQPRVPAGHHAGGQWTNKPGSGAPSQRREAIFDRSGKESWSSYVNTYRRDGTLAEQRVFNRDGSRIVSEFGDSSGRWNGPDDIAVMSFPANVYVKGKSDTADQTGAAEAAQPIWVGRLTEEEVANACERYRDIQRFTDEAAAKARRDRNDWTPQSFGTEGALAGYLQSERLQRGHRRMQIAG
jgi:hypothetical protein